MELIVQKFGGTSVSTPENRKMCFKHIKRELNDGKSVVIVVSAMGRKGQPYATDTLLSLVSNNDVGKREKDILMMTGELISSVVFSSELKNEGIECSVLTGGQAGIITNDEFGSALIMDVVPDKVVSELNKGKVVIVPGFQGMTINGEVTTLGRGGSDTTAAALAAGLHAEFVDIFTDVEFMMTADPRVVEGALPLREVTYEDVAQMAWGGATVIHPRAVELAMKHDILMRIRSTFSDNDGTVVSRRTFSKREFDAKEAAISGVVSTNKINRFTISLTETNKDFFDLFCYLKEAQISIDFINITEEKVYFTVSENDSQKLEQFLVYSKQFNFHYSIDKEVSKVALVGSAINGVPGIMTRVVKGLSDVGIKILQTSDSNTTIWILVHSENEKEAVRQIHKAFFK